MLKLFEATVYRAGEEPTRLWFLARSWSAAADQAAELTGGWCGVVCVDLRHGDRFLTVDA